MMRKAEIIIGTAIAVIVIVAAYNALHDRFIQDDAAEIVAEYRKISAEEANELLNETDNVILLDVRSNGEYQERHIPGAVLIPDYAISRRAETELPDKSALILVYCRSGRRSEIAANELVDMGYTNVYDFGGITDWPYETE